MDEFWVDGSGASESMTADAIGLDGFGRVLPGNKVGGADDTLLPLAGYERLRLLVD